MQDVHVRTGVWYQDRTITLFFPKSWDVTTYWPDTPPPLTDAEIREKFLTPIGQVRLKDLARGKKKPIIIVDDLTRPTPVHRVMPLILEEFRLAGLRSADVRILVAAGTHGVQDREALERKIGRESVESCTLIQHDDKKRMIFIGKTSFGTPVYVNPHILDGDLVIGVGGIYPQHTTGFGGGSKLALGVLGRKSITYFHFARKKSGGAYCIQNDYRRDVTEIARMIRLNTIYTLHVDAHQEVVNLTGGDHFTYYPQAADFSKRHYTAPPPDDADLVIANAYPSDVYFTFLRKSERPVRMATREATKVIIASNYGGLGHHGLFPSGNNQWTSEYVQFARRISVMSYREIVTKIGRNLLSRDRRGVTPSGEDNPVSETIENYWLFQPEGADLRIMDGMEMSRLDSWEKCIQVTERAHPYTKKIRVRIYPCAPLQCLEPAAR